MIEYDADGNLDRDATDAVLRKNLPYEEARDRLLLVIDAAVESGRSLNGVRSGLDMAEQDERWLKHWGMQ